MNIIERHAYNRIRRLYTEGYGLTWIKRYTQSDEATISRAVQLPYEYEGPVQPLHFYP